MGKLWAQIVAEQMQQEAQQNQLKNAVRRDLDTWFLPVDGAAGPQLNLTQEESRSDPSERRRLEQKFLLAEALKNYGPAMQQDAGLAEIFRLAKEYSDTQATATYGSYETEGALAVQIYKRLKRYQTQLDEQALTEAGDSYNFYERQVIAANLFSYFERLRDGDLNVPPPKKGEKIYRVDGVARAPQSAFWRKDERQDDDAPLFTHEPNANDIRQGDLGDCYLLATLSSIASTHPEKIRQAMHDEGNGKVTVRFYTRNKNDIYTPVYVTVEKVVPSGLGPIAEFGRNSLWVQTFERAWAASGLQMIKKQSAYCRPVPPNVDELYNQFLARQRTGPAITKTEREDNPWLFDKAGKLRPWQPSYAAIEGGESDYVLQSILGPGYSAELERDREQVGIFYKDGKLNLTRAGKESLIQTFLNAWDAIHPEDPMNPQRAEVFKRDCEKSTFTEMRAVYEIMFQTTPLLDDTGKIDAADRYYAFAEKILPAIDFELKRPELRSKDDLKRWYRSDPRNAILNSVCQTLEANIGPLSADERDAAGRAVDAMLRPVRDAVSNSRGAAAPPPLALNGEYSEDAVALFERIRAGERGGLPMTCSSKNKVASGLVHNHAYSLCGVRTKTVGGKEFRFVRIRNPWGTRARAYELRNGVLQGRSVSGTSGYMDLELNDYLNNFSDTHIVGPSAREMAWKKLERQLTGALAEYRDVVITEHTGPGYFGKKRTYHLDEVFKTTVNGVRHTFVRLSPDFGPRGVAMTMPIAKYFERFEHPQIGAVNPEKQKAAQDGNAAKEQKLADDFVRSEQAAQDWAQKQEDMERNAINHPQPGIRYPDLAETEFRLPYIHALGNLRNCFAGTDGKSRNGSNEYYNMRNALNQMVKTLERADSVLRTDGADAAAEAGRTARAYLRHCEEVSRTGARRRERVELAKKLLVVASCFESSRPKPQETLEAVVKSGRLNAVAAENLEEHPLDLTPEGLRRQLAGMVVDKFADIAENIPDRKPESDQIRASRKAREAAIDSVRNSECFRSAYGRMDAETMRKELRRGEEAVYIRVAKEYNRLEKLAKNAPAEPAPERTDRAELLK